MLRSFSQRFQGSLGGSKESGSGGHSHPRVSGRKNQKSIEMAAAKEAQEELERRKGAIIKDLSTTSMKHDFSDENDTLASKLERHRAGNLFKYAVISTAPPKDRGSILEKVRSFRAKNDVVLSSLDDLPAINLINNFTEFRLSQALGQVKLSSLPPYTIVTDVLVHYIPMDTFFAISHPLEIQINDFRKSEDTTVRHYTLTDKGAYNILFCMDYSTMTTDLEDMSLSFACNATGFREGKAWAAVKIIIRMSHGTFPQKANLQETIGVTLWAHSDLEDYLVDPTSMDGTISGEALKLLKQAYLRGDIEDLVTPRDNKKQMNLARTVVGESGANLPPDLMIESMREQALSEERKRSARFGGVTNIGDSMKSTPVTYPIKPAMKKTSPFEAGRAAMGKDEQENESNSKQGDMKPGDSYSNAGSSTATEDVGREPERLSKLSDYHFQNA